jgi:hypothetical protein
MVAALFEVAATFPLTEEPDFVVSLGTGEPKLENEDVTSYRRFTQHVEE